MRMAQWMALVATTLCVALPAGVAHADWQTDRAQLIAAKAWNNPCAGKATLRLAAPPQSTWRAWTYQGLCLIELSDSQPWRWDELCPVIVHEYGHLAGYTDPLNPRDPYHSHDPKDIMAPFVHYDRRCDDYGSAYLGVPRPVEAPSGGVGGAVNAQRKPAKKAKRASRRARARRGGGAESARGSAGRSRVKGRVARRSPVR
jgi:hypothetical protein